MPSISFVLPHWLYWSGLIFFPLIAAWLARRQMENPPDGRPTYPIAYLFWALAGYLGIHRFYLRSAWGFVFIPFFLGIVYCNAQTLQVRDETSRTRAALEAVQDAAGQADPADAAKAKAEVEAKQRDFDRAKGVTDYWHTMTGRVAMVLALMLVVDAFLLPGLVRRRREHELQNRFRQTVELPPDEVHEGGVGQAASLGMHTKFTNWIDDINTRIGAFVAWWAVIAVFAYYYEVMARYIFNSPTNWVHESMFLMFGMQYMLCGAFAYKEDQHVRVDVVYAQLSRRGKAIADIVTSVFFFIFILTMLWTSARFAMDAVNVGEHSFTEWGVQYWPVKLTMPIGALLLTMQGVAKLIKDIIIVREEIA
ncbi:MAG TPA: TRAP transporter small permease subunit [Ramlibacter sp.]|uniref:TRAP transporter small permease subunit n=1 Tax=Ramlibacter sp. TaxID=1917967 RepID=UPI002C72525D|nr:TRAP transporter small permease subunit [Ramlibacter sp.]HVZ43297.1 TRAP transporter small permease subunit [Ramlibacter sp.]